MFGMILRTKQTGEEGKLVRSVIYVEEKKTLKVNYMYH